MKNKFEIVRFRRHRFSRILICISSIREQTHTDTHRRTARRCEIADVMVHRGKQLASDGVGGINGSYKNGAFEHNESTSPHAMSEVDLRDAEKRGSVDTKCATFDEALDIIGRCS